MRIVWEGYRWFTSERDNEPSDPSVEANEPHWNALVYRWLSSR